ncbi:MAG: response regulator [Pseudomonadota bacterium]
MNINNVPRIAIIEDNATARLNLRSHLLNVGDFDIASYSNGRELRNGLRTMDFDAIFVDFHLGQNKTGVEWVNTLRENKLLKPSTGLIFITSDSMPNTVSQILDLYPDLILIKPYTIKNLLVSFEHYLKVREKTSPALQYLNKEQHEHALDYLNNTLDSSNIGRYKSDVIKLKGRILLEAQRYEEAAELYAGILRRSQNVIWAHWGLIKCEFFIGKWTHCQGMLDKLIEESLTKDKAYEWMACVEIGKKNYSKAEALLDKVLESELTIQATRLKTLCYQMQGKTEDAVRLLERKIQSNISVRERLVDFTMELARYHLHLAEQVAKHHKQEELNQARRLIGRASRSKLDKHVEMQKDYMLALAHLLENDHGKAHQLMSTNEQVHQVEDATIMTKVDAVKVWFGLGETEKAHDLLQSCDEQLIKQVNHIDSVISSELVNDAEQKLGLEKDRAIAINEKGTRYFRENNHNKAISCFFRAYQMFPGVPAFSLNLLQSLYECGQSEYKGVCASKLIEELNTLALNERNRSRFTMLKMAFSEHKDTQAV